MSASLISKNCREALVQRAYDVFKNLPPISDAELYPKGFSSTGTSADILSIVRGRHRFELLASEKWLDPEIVDRMSGYARWYFSPTIIILTLRHSDQYEFDALLNIFKYSDSVLFDVGIDTIDGKKVDVSISKLGMNQYVAEMSIEDYLPATEKMYGSLSTEHFAVSASWFNSIEKKFVSEFLRWLSCKWPDDLGIQLALTTFWER